VKIVIACCIGIPPVLLLTLGIPPIIPRFVICSSVAAMSRPMMIRDTIKKLKREAAHKKKHGHNKEEKEPGCCGKRSKSPKGAKHSHSKKESKAKHHHEHDEEETKGLNSSED